MAIVTPSPDSVRASRQGPSDTWQEAIRTAIRDPVGLCRFLALPRHIEESAARCGRAFSLFVPRNFAAKMKPGDPRDPLLVQVLPTLRELDDEQATSLDPVSDQSASLVPGLIKKYERRVLLITTGACAIHCRYCFRRHFPYAAMPHSIREWEPALRQIAADTTIEEVLFSGGDPLMLTDDQLADLAERLAQIPHIKRLRVHTRLPIMVPQRVTTSMIRWLTGTRLNPFVVVHSNHPHEIDGEVERVLRSMVHAGIPVLNQSVLLRGVNDCVDVLVELSQRLIAAQVLPYYLHQLDRVTGATHFEVPVERGREYIHQMRKLLPGYAIPRYVRETAGQPSKTVLA